MQTAHRNEPRPHPYDDLDLSGVNDAFATRLLEARRRLDDQPWMALMLATGIHMEAMHLRKMLPDEPVQLAATRVLAIARHIMDAAKPSLGTR